MSARCSAVWCSLLARRSACAVCRALHPLQGSRTLRPPPCSPPGLAGPARRLERSPLRVGPEGRRLEEDVVGLGHEDIALRQRGQRLARPLLESIGAGEHHIALRPRGPGLFLVLTADQRIQNDGQPEPDSMVPGGFRGRAKHGAALLAIWLRHRVAEVVGRPARWQQCRPTNHQEVLHQAARKQLRQAANWRNSPPLSEPAPAAACPQATWESRPPDRPSHSWGSNVGQGRVAASAGLSSSQPSHEPNALSTDAPRTADKARVPSTQRTLCHASINHSLPNDSQPPSPATAHPDSSRVKPPMAGSPPAASLAAASRAFL